MNFTMLGRILDMGHATLHSMPDPGPDDDTTLVALTEKDFVLIGTALPVLEILIGECIHQTSKNLQERLLEVVRVQQPSWVINDPDMPTDAADAAEGSSS